MLKVTPSELQFGTLAVNETPAYCRFCVQNIDPHASLSVRLTALSYSSAIRFQLFDSALLSDDDDDESGVHDALRRSSVSPSAVRFYNTAFDSINVIDLLELQPNEVREIVAIFNPDPVVFPNVVERTAPILVSGSVHLTSTTLPTMGQTPPLAPRENVGCSVPLRASSSRLCGGDDGFLPLSLSRRELESHPRQGLLMGHTAVRSETITLPFSATVFLSLFTVSTSEFQVTMGPNKTHLLGFKITNVSPLPLQFVIRAQTMAHKNVELTVYEEEKLEVPQVGRVLALDGHASMNFTIIIHTTALAEPAVGGGTMKRFCHRTVLQCDNLRDARNSELISVNVNVVPERLQKPLVSVADPNLDFGAVYRGTQVLREVCICNVSREDLTVRLLHARPQHCEGLLSLVRKASSATNSEKDIQNKDDKNPTKVTDASENRGTTVDPCDQLVLVDELVMAAQKGALQVGVLYIASTDSEYKGTANLRFELDLVITACEASATIVKREQRVVVRCVAALFTSTIVASLTNINFGDCAVGETRRVTFHIENPSPLPTTINVQLRSKIVSIEGVPPRLSATGAPETMGEFSIAPQSSLPLTLRMTPQRVNPTYCKQLTVVNTSNPAEDRLILTIEANNMQPGEMNIHNEFYTCEFKPLCYDDGMNPIRGGTSGENGAEIDERGVCGTSQLRVIAHVPLIVAYTLRSRVSYPLPLQLSTTGLEIDTFCLEGMPCAELEALAVELHSCCCFGDEDTAGKVVPERAEEAREGVMRALRTCAVSVRSVVLEPLSSTTVYACILRNSVTGSDVVTKEDGINIAMENVELRRFVRLSYRACATGFELGGQRAMHFGEVNVGERKSTKLPIVNQCNSLLLLRVTKSRSVMAGYIRVDGSDRNSIYIRVRPFATKELELSFCPGLKGNLEERIQFTNILNPGNEVKMTLKATVTKAETFDVSPDSWNFGFVPVPLFHSVVCGVGTEGAGTAQGGGKSAGGVACDESGRPVARVGARFTVSNTSSTRRALRLKLDTVVSNNGEGGGENAHGQLERFFRFEGVDMRLQLEMERGGASSGSSRKLEERIERLEQKLKIYRRKNKTDKVAGAVRQIEELKRALMGELVDLNTPDVDDGDTKHKDVQQRRQEQQLSDDTPDDKLEKIGTSKVLLQEHDELASLLRDGISLSEVSAGESVIIVLYVACTRVAEHIPATQSVILTFVLYEANDTEASRSIPVDITLVRPEDEVDIEEAPRKGTLTFGLGQTVAERTVEPNLSGVSPLTPRSPSHPGSDLPSPMQASRDAPGVVAQPARQSTALGGGLTSFISLETSDGVGASLFMGFPVVSLSCAVQERCDFTFYVRTTMDTSIVVLGPIRCCSPDVVTSGNCGGDMDGMVGACGAVDGHKSCEGMVAVKHFVPTEPREGGRPLYSATCSSLRATVRTLDAQFKFSRRRGAPHPFQPLPIVVQCTPASSGPQRYFIPVCNLQDEGNVAYLVVNLNSVPLGEGSVLKVSTCSLSMRDTILPCDPALLDVQSFTVRSCVNQSHALLIRSNRPSLVRLFEDAKCSFPLKNPVKRQSLEKFRVYVQLCPSEHSRKHASRIVTAGILIEAIVHAKGTNSGSGGSNCDTVPAGQCGYAIIAHSVVRVRARIGSGELVLRESSVDMGSVAPHCQQAHTTVTVWNPSDCFEVRARLVPSTPRTHVGIPEIALPPGGKVEVPITLNLPSPGLVRESISLYNLTCRQKPLSIRLSVLRRDEAISVSIVPYESPETREPLPSTTAVCPCHTQSCSGVLIFPTAAVVLGEGGMFRLHNRVVSTAMRVTNSSVRSLILIARGSAPFVFGHPDDAPQLPRMPLQHDDDFFSMYLPSSPGSVSSSLAETETEEEAQAEVRSPSHLSTRGRLLLDARQTETVAWTLTSAPPFTMKQRERLLQHELITVEAKAYVYVGQVVEETTCFPFSDMMFSAVRPLPVAEQCVLVPKFLLNFALSEGFAEPHVIDLGVVVSRDQVTSGTLCSSTAEAPPKTAGAVLVNEGGGRKPAAQAEVLATNAQLSDGKDSASVNRNISIRLTNLSSILPLRLSVECEPTVRFANNRITVPPGGAIQVEAVLVPKLIQSEGPFRLAVYFVNEQNPENDMVVYVTGQYYRRLFKISWDGAADGDKDSLSMKPLRLEDISSSTSSVLSQTKISMTAVEPNIEVGVRAVVDPKLRGVIQLQALQYDTSSTLQSVIFCQAQPPAMLSNTNTGSSSAGGLTTSNVGVFGGGPTAGTIGGSANAVGTTASGVGACNILPGASLVGSVGSSFSAACGGATEGTTVSPAPGKGVVVCTKDHQQFRLRCVLVKEDFAALAGAFFGQRKHRLTADILRERQGLTFAKLEELKSQHSALSQTMWIGTLFLSSEPTAVGEELQIFSSLSTFCTFKVSPKLVLRPQCSGRTEPSVPAAGVVTPEAMHVYDGELFVFNPCKEHVVRLSVTPLLSCEYNGGVIFQCMPCDGECEETVGRITDYACREGGNNSFVGTEAKCCYTANSTGSQRTSNLHTRKSDSDGAHPADVSKETAKYTGDASQPTVIVKISPQNTVRIRVVLCIDQSCNRSSVERGVGLALFDECVSCSFAAVRVSLAPADDTGEDTAQKKEQSGQPPRQLFHPSVSSGGTTAGSSGPYSCAEGPTPKGERGGPVDNEAGGVCRAGPSRNKALDAPLHAKHNNTEIAVSRGVCHHSVLSLRGNCTEVGHCRGVYTSSFSFSKDSVPTTDITITNHLSDAAVEYVVAVVSQGPQPWLLLPAVTAVLEPGETQPLRLNIVSTDAGSFVGHVSISSNATPGELILLKLTAEVFLPTAGEGLFEILTGNGQRLSSGMEKDIFVGRLFGEGTHRARVALEIVNRSSVPLEFPVSMGKSLRLEYVSDAREEVDPVMLGKCKTDAAVVRDIDQGIDPSNAWEPVHGDTGELRRHGNCASGERDSGVVSNVSSPRCCVRLLVCHLHSVSAMRGERHFVVNPKSRLKVAFLVVCDHLQLPEGLFASGEAEVVLTCRQARDSRYVFKTRFQVRRPSFAVQREQIFTQAEGYATALAVTNLHSHEALILFRAVSPVLVVQVPDGQEVGDPSSLQVTVAGGATAVINVRLDISRLAELYNWSSATGKTVKSDGDADPMGCDVGALLQPLSEHGVLLNVRNPREQVRVEFRFFPSNVQVSSTSPPSVAPASAAYPAPQSMKSSRWLHYEKWLYRFVQQFSRVLSEVSEFLLPKILEYASHEDFLSPSLAESVGNAVPMARTALLASSCSNSDTAHAGGGGSNSTVVGIVTQDTLSAAGQLNHRGGLDGGGEGCKSDRLSFMEDRMFSSQCAQCWRALHELLVDLSWLTEELVYYSIMLSNSRAIEAYSVFLATSVSGHQLLRVWRHHRTQLPPLLPFVIFEQIIEAIDTLPC